MAAVSTPPVAPRDRAAAAIGGRRGTRHVPSREECRAKHRDDREGPQAPKTSIRARGGREAEPRLHPDVIPLDLEEDRRELTPPLGSASRLSV